MLGGNEFTFQNNDELMSKLQKLKSHATKVEFLIPLQSLMTHDEMY